ncbi:ATP-binding protein [Streptomyces sp. NBC_00237]|uniref:ATP-binding protein n=1 Tax=Streptomyces sp. NBC_00237 TaxID=2975687 RepID=UPI00225512A8|nr:ATP-binding protein [Streptomyces sp. NBC_00237]MCX5206034.1 ATP-binding protein [Streptomyces sp. NBC_00237]
MAPHPVDHTASASERSCATGQAPYEVYKLPRTGDVRPWPGRIRQIVAAKLRHADYPEGVVYRAKLVVSELVTNGFQHGSGDTVDFGYLVHDDGVFLAVDSGSPVTVPEAADPLGTDAESGRGLFLVSEYADFATIARNRVWAVLNASGDAA